MPGCWQSEKNYKTINTASATSTPVCASSSCPYLRWLCLRRY